MFHRLRRLVPFFLTSILPLCGGDETYRVWDMVTFEALSQALNAQPKWLEVRKPIETVPDLPAKLADQARTTTLPGFERDAPKNARSLKHHRRCASCHSL